MSKTLFWYLMRDLLRIFAMTSVVLAGIMSFGGLLKPLMNYGLNGTQVAQMLLFFMPATQTYSLPIAALFATTIVYGRLSADNELTACRAAGVSYLSLSLPGFVLGLVLSLLSLASLSYIVPLYTLKVEKVAFASLADVVRKNIQRNHQIKFSGANIFAEDAEILPPPAGRPNDEVVVLRKPMFCIYDQRMDEASRTRINIPSEFFTARSATLLIQQGGDQAEFTATLEEGVKFPRQIIGKAVGGIGAAQVGPVQIPSLIKENPKFMDLDQLKKLHKKPLRSRSIRELYREITRQEQEQDFLMLVLDALRKKGEYRFDGPGDEAARESLTLKLDGETARQVQAGRLKPAIINKSKLVLTGAPLAASDIQLIRKRGSVGIMRDHARNATVRVRSNLATDRMGLDFDLEDARIEDLTLGPDQAQPQRPQMSRPFSIATPAAQLKIKDRGPEYYLPDQKGVRVRRTVTDEQNKLQRKVLGLQCNIAAEIHGRASFAVSCLILVMIGSALGMMFRTGNYLSAFALSVIPALLCIALVCTGQHVVEAEPRNLQMGLGIIWSGNAMVLVLATVLLGRLQRQ